MPVAAYQKEVTKFWCSRSVSGGFSVDKIGTEQFLPAHGRISAAAAT